MNVRQFLLTAVSISVLSGLLLDNASFAQEPGLFAEGADRVPKFDFREQPSKSNVKASRMSVSELRQTRALYRANQRVARIEHNLWMRREPLRPNWNAVPMMSSRYSNRRVIVPIYVRTR
jgi:hypothetical protein